MAKKRIGAAKTDDFIEYLNDSSEYQGMMREKEEQWAERRRILDEDQNELIAECQAVGHPIKSVWDFVNTDESYAAAIPILVKHLEKGHHPRTREGIIRALSTPEAWGVASPEPLIKLFREETDPESEMKWLLGSAIAHTATLAEAMTICELIEDESHGASREFLPLALIHCPQGAARGILEPLVGHPVMGKSASKTLSLLGN